MRRCNVGDRLSHGPVPSTPRRQDVVRGHAARHGRSQPGRHAREHSRGPGNRHHRGRPRGRHRLLRHLALVRQRQERAALRPRAAHQAARQLRALDQGRTRACAPGRSRHLQASGLGRRPAVRAALRLHARRRTQELRDEPCPPRPQSRRGAADPRPRSSPPEVGGGRRGEPAASSTAAAAGGRSPTSRREARSRPSAPASISSA